MEAENKDTEGSEEEKTEENSEQESGGEEEREENSKPGSGEEEPEENNSESEVQEEDENPEGGEAPGEEDDGGREDDSEENPEPESGEEGRGSEPPHVGDVETKSPDDMEPEELYRDALSLVWDDFELPPEEILMLDGLRDRFEIDQSTHSKMEKEVLEEIIKNREKMGLDMEMLVEYCKKGLEKHEDWKQGYQMISEYLKKSGKEKEAEEWKKKLGEMEAEKEPEEQKAVSCPKCGADIPVEKWEFPMKLKCPECGSKGVLKGPPK